MPCRTRTDDELFDPYEQALLWTESDVGIVVTPDEQMHLLAISDRVVTDSVGHSVDTLTGGAGVVFWLGATDPSVAVNRMATLNLFAAAGMSARGSARTALPRADHWRRSRREADRGFRRRN